MPYFVKSRGPAVLNRGPFETYREANARRDELQQEPLYAGQEVYVEYVPAEPERRHAPLDPPRRKYRSGSRSGSRVGGALCIEWWFAHWRSAAKEETHEKSGPTSLMARAPFEAAPAVGAQATAGSSAADSKPARPSCAVTEHE